MQETKETFEIVEQLDEKNKAIVTMVVSALLTSQEMEKQDAKSKTVNN